MKVLMVFGLLAFVGLAHAQVTCQTYGNTTSCNGTLSQPRVTVTPLQDYGALMNSAARSQAEIQAMQAQANLANAQAALLRQQQIAAEQQADAARRAAVEVATPAGNTNSLATVRLDGLTAEEAIRDPKQEELAAQRLLIPQAQFVAAIAAAPYKDLKEKADFYDAVRSAAPRDSAMYRLAAEVVPLLYAEMAKRAP